jgi:predicted O-methyltransferase YrrM
MLIAKSKRLRQIVGLTETMSVLSFRLWLSRPAAIRTWPGLCYRQFVSLAKRDLWQSRELEELFPDIQSMDVRIPFSPGRGIITDPDELVSVAVITKARKPQRMFEIGTFRGRTTRILAMNSGASAVVYTLDLPPNERDQFRQCVSDADNAIIANSETGADYRGTPEEAKIKQLFGNSMEFDFSPFENQMDMVIVDGAHHYEAAKKDSVNAIRMVSKGGWVLWHDFANYGDYADVTRAVLDTVPSNEVIQIGRTQYAAWVKP